jgi:long-subunit acyl-CoA synthetase (AMP-forming)
LSAQLSYREREIIYQLNDSGAAILITHSKLWPVVESARPQLKSLRKIILVGDETFSDATDVTLYWSAIANQPAGPPSGEVNPESLVALPYSSGTTGLPKGVMLTHRNLVCNHTQYVFAMQLTADDSYIVYMPLSHIYGVALMGPRSCPGRSRFCSSVSTSS